MRIAVLIPVVLALMMSACSEKSYTISGEVFIRESDEKTVRLSLVDVSLYDYKTMSLFTSKKLIESQPLADYLNSTLAAYNDDIIAPKARYESAGKEYNNNINNQTLFTILSQAWIALILAEDNLTQVKSRLNYLSSATYYFANLPTPLQSTKTDSEGKFAFSVSSGTYAVVAVDKTSAEESNYGYEKYHWMVKVNINQDTKIILANNNLSNGMSNDSLITTIKDKDEFCVQVGDMITTLDSSGKETRNYKKAVVSFDMLKSDIEIAKRYQKGLEEKKRVNARTQQTKKEEKQHNEVIAETPLDEPVEQVPPLKTPYPKTPKLIFATAEEAQKEAVRRYPDLAITGSKLNTEFVLRYKQYKLVRPDYFRDPSWPFKLAEESVEAIKSK
jgi:hypothetical protein